MIDKRGIGERERLRNRGGKMDILGTRSARARWMIMRKDDGGCTEGQRKPCDLARRWQASCMAAARKFVFVYERPRRIEEQRIKYLDGLVRETMEEEEADLIGGRLDLGRTNARRQRVVEGLDQHRQIFGDPAIAGQCLDVGVRCGNSARQRRRLGEKQGSDTLRVIANREPQHSR